MQLEINSIFNFGWSYAIETVKLVHLFKHDTNKQIQVGLRKKMQVAGIYYALRIALCTGEIMCCIPVRGENRWNFKQKKSYQT